MLRAVPTERGELFAKRDPNQSREGRTIRRRRTQTVGVLRVFKIEIYAPSSKRAPDCTYSVRIYINKNPLSTARIGFSSVHKGPGTPYLSILCTQHYVVAFFYLKITIVTYFVHNSHMWSDAQKGYFPQHTRNSRKAVTSNFTKGTF